MLTPLRRCRSFSVVIYPPHTPHAQIVPVSVATKAGRESDSNAEQLEFSPMASFSRLEKGMRAESGLFFLLSCLSSFSRMALRAPLPGSLLLISAWPPAGRFLKFCCLSEQNRTLQPNLNRTIDNIYNSITYQFSCLAFI